jgi:hypothetical protein
MEATVKTSPLNMVYVGTCCLALRPRYSIWSMRKYEWLSAKVPPAAPVICGSSTSYTVDFIVQPGV